MQVIFYFLWDHWAHPGYFENGIPLKPALGAYAASHTTVLHMMRLNQTESPFFVILCVLCWLLLTPHPAPTPGCCFVVYSTRRFVLSLALSYYVLVFYSPFSIAITSLGEEWANLSAFYKFVRFAIVWLCLFPFPLGVWEGLRPVIMALPDVFSYLFIPRHTIVAGYYGFTLDVHVSVRANEWAYVGYFFFLHYSLYSVEY